MLSIAICLVFFFVFKQREILPAPSFSVSEVPKKRKKTAKIWNHRVTCFWADGPICPCKNCKGAYECGEGLGLRAYNQSQFIFFCFMNLGLDCLSLTNPSCSFRKNVNINLQLMTEIRLSYLDCALWFCPLITLDRYFWSLQSFWFPPVVN